MSGLRQPNVSIWSPAYFWTTAGAVALIFLAAFESLAVTTVMPVVSEDLDGASLYAVAFAGTLASSVIGMILVGIWCDRDRPFWPVAVSVGVFIAGLLIAAVATTMPVLVVGRLVQGLGSGGQIVALYVVVARAYPSAVHGRVFAAFSAAWVIPSLVGPFLAGVVADTLHWRWVFGGVAVLTLVAFGMVTGKLWTIRGPSGEHATPRMGLRIIAAFVVAIGATVLSMLGDWQLTTPLLLAAAVALLVIIAVGVRPLVPAGTLRAAPGVASVVTMRALIGGAMLGAEVYVPYLLREEYHFTPTLAGLGLTGAAVLWSTASEIQGRIGDRLGNTRTAVIGVTIMVVSIGVVALLAFATAPAWLIIVAWSLAGAGIGFVFPRLSVLGLAYSNPQNQGFISSALTIADSLGTSAAIAVFGLIAALGGGFAAVFAAATVLALLAYVPGTRLGHAHEDVPNAEVAERAL